MTQVLTKAALVDQSTIIEGDLKDMIESYKPLVEARLNGRENLKGLICGPLFSQRPTGEALADIRSGKAPIPDEIFKKLNMVTEILLKDGTLQKRAPETTELLQTPKAEAVVPAPANPALALQPSPKTTAHGPTSFLERPTKNLHPPLKAPLTSARVQAVGQGLIQTAQNGLKVTSAKIIAQDFPQKMRTGLKSAQAHWENLSPNAKRWTTTAAFALSCIALPQLSERSAEAEVSMTDTTALDSLSSPDNEGLFGGFFNVFSRSASNSLEINDVKPSDCHEGKPVIFVGARNRYEITNIETCRRLVDQAIPSVGQTIYYNSKMGLTGNEDGSFTFHLEGRPDHKITEQNFRAMVEGWLLMGGIPQTPGPWSFLLAKFDIESQHGNFSEGFTSSAKGINQFMPDTWPQRMMQFGHLIGYGDIREKLYDVFRSIKATKEANARRSGRDNYTYHLDFGDLAKDKRTRALFERFASDPNSSATLGVINSMLICKALQERLDKGEFPHPIKDGNGQPLKEVTGAMCYVGHFLGETGAAAFYKQLDKTPNMSIERFIKSTESIRNSAYDANILLSHVTRVTGKDGKSKTIRTPLKLNELHERLSSRGFDQRPITGLNEFEIPERLSASDLGIDLQDETSMLKIANDERVMGGIFGKPSFLLQVFENTTPAMVDSLNRQLRETRTTARANDDRPEIPRHVPGATTQTINHDDGTRTVIFNFD